MKLVCFVLLQISTYSSQLNDLIGKFLSEQKTENMVVSVSIRKADNQKEIFAYNSKLAMAPASTIKLLTTATSMSALGKDHRFQTNIFTYGEIKEGVLNGDLLIEGSGDPTFGAKRFGSNPLNQITEFLKKQGISSINGKIKIVGKNSIQIQENWLVGDVGNYYGAFPSDFNFNENTFSIFFNGGKNIGDSALVAGLSPFSNEWKIINNVVSGPKGSGDNVNILNLPFSNDYMFNGTVPIESRNFEVKGAISNVGRVFIDLLTEKLSANKIQIKNEIVSDTASIKKVLGVISSPTLNDIALVTNHRSVNFFADGLANHLLRQAPDSLKSFDSFIKNYWNSKGLSLSNFRFLDGSGLSTQNAFCTNSMTIFLAKIYESPIFSDFVATIPIVGKSGTVASLDSKNLSSGKIYAKSGSISGIRNYSGYFKNNQNEFFCFSIYLSGINTTVQTVSRQFLENILLKMID